MEIPTIDDLTVTDIKSNSAILKFHSNGIVEAPGSAEGNGYHFDLKIFDVDDVKHNDYVLKKRFDPQQNNAIYKMDLMFVCVS